MSASARKARLRSAGQVAGDLRQGPWPGVRRRPLHRDRKGPLLALMKVFANAGRERMAIINFKNMVTVDFDGDALTTVTAGEFILNFGALTTFGDLANGIFAGANDVTVRNF